MLTDIERMARSDAWAIERGDVAITNVEWWVGERSYDLGIVDSRGMVNLAAERANEYRKAFKRYAR